MLLGIDLTSCHLGKDHRSKILYACFECPGHIVYLSQGCSMCFGAFLWKYQGDKENTKFRTGYLGLCPVQSWKPHRTASLGNLFQYLIILILKAVFSTVCLVCVCVYVACLFIVCFPLTVSHNLSCSIFDLSYSRLAPSFL